MWECAIGPESVFLIQETSWKRIAMKKNDQSEAGAKAPEEKLLTVRRAASLLGLPYRQLLLEVSTGQVRTYTVGKSRKYVFASELLSFLRLKTKTKE
jgi:hypothetical protein